MSKVLMFQGTGSGVGKSILVAGFCRLLANRGKRVAPFKGQNMALNSGVTPDGLEMGRAQFLQAEAARILPDVHMNPILLKPQGNHRSQLIRLGKTVGSFQAREYYELFEENFQIVKKAFDTLTREYDYIVMEGAGSPAEINLQKTDMTNMKIAAYAQASVFVIGDIDRGGVFAWLKGTYDLIEDVYKPLIKGFIINKFRGDETLLQPGIDMFARMVPVKIVGTLPFMTLDLDEEDSQGIASRPRKNARFKIAVLRYPFMSNFTDFAPFKILDEISLHFVTTPDSLDEMDLIILPGSKNTISDLLFLKQSGLFRKLQSLFGHKLIIGICGGFQMLGRRIADPQGIESPVSQIEGLGFIDMETRIGKEKVLKNRHYHGRDFLHGITCSAYEIHMGTSQLYDSRPAQVLQEPNTCIFLEEKKLLGTYLHGFFDHSEVAQRVINLVDSSFKVRGDYFEEKQRQLDQLAASLETHCDLETILPR